MKVYIVYEIERQTFSNDACYEDGYYDDYYEDVVETETVRGIYSSQELAQKAVDKLFEDEFEDYNYFVYRECEVLDKLEESNDEKEN